MKKYLVLLSLGMVFLSVSAFAENRDKGMFPADGFFIHKGDKVQGRAAFQKLKCTACHWVANDAELSEGPVAEKTGPILGAKQAKYSRGWLADSIVSPSHVISVGSNGEAQESELSRMGDFSDTMTVRQLMDVVEYLKSLRGEKASTPA